MKNKKIAIIGCGNLGLSILNGLLKEGITPNNLVATKRNLDSIRNLEKTGITITTDNVQAVEDSEIIIVALKPYKIMEVLGELKDHFNPEKHVVVSLATGISIEQIKATLQQGYWE